MKKKKETRGRKPKAHKPIAASFDEVLLLLGRDTRAESN
jgi:hypothetical protein